MFEFLKRTPHGRRLPDMPPVLDEGAYLDRRSLVKALGLGSIAASLPGCGPSLGQGAEGHVASLDAYPSSQEFVPSWSPAGGKALYPAKRNPAYEGGRAIVPEKVAATNNNFYEFTTRKSLVYRRVAAFEPRPWKVEIGGLVEEEKTVDIDEIARIAPLEERIYRLRCVERWSMVIPWTGLPMAKFVKWCKPKPEAKFIRFVSFNRPEQAPGQKNERWWPWPYYEGLRLDEAMNPLTLVTTGVFGHGLPAQHGAPIRVIVPWKYGYKSPKSFVKVEFVKEQPHTFWEDSVPDEYPFLSNVDPAKPHPRWSQAREQDIGTGETLRTQPYNGYAAEVAKLYAS